MSTAGPSEHSSGDRHRRLRLAVHLLLGLLTVALGVWAGLRWSLIAIGVDQRVADTSWAEEGPAFKVLQLEDGRTLTIDDDLMGRMGGPEAVSEQRLRSAFGERVAVLGDHRIELTLSSTAWRTIAALTVIAALGAARLRRHRMALSGRGPGRHTGRPRPDPGSG